MIAPRRLTVVTIALVAMGRALPAQSADSIIAKYVAARGGLDRLHAIQTERLTGRFSSPGGEGADTVELARPGRVRTQITFNGQSFIQAYDGSTAWTVNPFGGSGAPEALPPAAAANVIRSEERRVGKECRSPW